MAHPRNSPLKLVNASGFLFQLRVEQNIESTEERHHWLVSSREHRWVDPLSHDERFIDLVLAKDREPGYSLHVAVECKRLSGGHWVFLVPEPRPSDTERSRLLWTHRDARRPPVADWADWFVEPPSPESSFCVVRGQSDKDKPMLERLAGELLRSLEYLAAQDLDPEVGPSADGARVYAPLIVTNATLQVCCFSIDDISEGGTLEEGQAVFQEVPLIRFRKSLSTTRRPLARPKSVSEEARWSERTVFVATASELPSILRRWQTKHAGHYLHWYDPRVPAS